MNNSQSSNSQSSGAQMQDKEILTDVLTSQKHVTETYNSFANECATPNIRDEFMRILEDEHKIQAEVFDDMKKRGWYPTPAAEQQKIQQAKQKFQNQNQQ
ncbi:spore coat protein [Caproiciproducens galactitolivorans]|uniref:Coat F domain protein n=1 Tax=Caproiciproducens galactitolivorans TaxID=642589 RepID=A0A4Z0XY57_9FIRM|nr:spore coat protein [Caproiciproducens galactitolivorans]TGJ76459.1 coat F domain protein [Caproiciproducens galactitolivorans]